MKNILKTTLFYTTGLLLTALLAAILHIIDRDTDWLAKELRIKQAYSQQVYKQSLEAGNPEYKARLEQQAYEFEYDIYLDRAKAPTITHRLLGNGMETVAKLK